MNHWFKYSIVHIYFELKCARKFVFSSIRYYLLRLVQIITRNYVIICKPEIETKKLDLDKNEKKREGTWKKKETIETIPSARMFHVIFDVYIFGWKKSLDIWMPNLYEQFQSRRNLKMKRMPSAKFQEKLVGYVSWERESYYYKPFSHSERQLSATYRQFTCHWTIWQLLLFFNFGQKILAKKSILHNHKKCQTITKSTLINFELYFSGASPIRKSDWIGKNKCSHFT